MSRRSLDAAGDDQWSSDSMLLHDDADGAAAFDDDGGGDFDPDAVGGKQEARVLTSAAGFWGTLKLVATLIKSFIGSGVLFLPQAFYNGGYLFSVITMVAFAVITQVTIMRLIECRKLHPASYGRLGGLAVGLWGERAVNISLVLSQAGFGCVYIVFIARNVLQIANASSCWLSGRWLFALILAQFFIFTPLTWVRRIASFGPTNIAADVLIFGGLIGILAYSIRGLALSTAPLNLQMFNAQSFSLLLGTAVYAYEGVAMVVPVYDSLTPSAQARFPTILSATLAGITATYCIVGLVPYMYFAGALGITVQDTITLNLPRVWWSWGITAGYCLALLFSYPLMLFPAIRIIESWLAHSGLLMPGPSSRWRRNGVRALIVAITLGVAIVGSEQLGNFVSLIGAFCCVPLAFIYPALFHLRLVKAGCVSRALDIAIIIFGCGVFVFSTYEAIAGWSISPINPCITTGTTQAASQAS